MSDPQQIAPVGETPPALVSAIRRILTSLVRLLMHFRMAYPQLTELLKSTYVEIAEREFQLPAKPQTDTRLSLLTGIHRKDIKRLRTQLSSDEEEPLAINQGVRIVSRWVGEPAYLDDQKQPIKLPFKSTDGSESFESLVVEVCRQDLRPRVVLDEWLRLGIVSMDEDNILTLNAGAFVPSKGLNEKSYFLGMNVADHLNAATHNLLDLKPAFFDRCVYYDGLSDESVGELKALAESKSMETLKAINERAAALKAIDEKNSGNQQRINVGIYAFHETSITDNKDSS